jgi:hypothetical protein
MKTTNYEAPRYAALYTLPSLYPTLVKIFSSIPCSQTPSVYVPPLLSETMSIMIFIRKRDKIIFPHKLARYFHLAYSPVQSKKWYWTAFSGTLYFLKQ